MKRVWMGAAMIATVSAVPALALAMSAPTYIAKAGAGDLFEKQTSELLLTTSKNEKLRGFAKQMIADHTTSTNEVKAAASAAHLKVAPPLLNAEQTANVAKLRAAKGTARDALYISEQKTSHQQALELQQGYATSGGSAPLKAVASKIVPVVKSHIAMLSGM